MVPARCLPLAAVLLAATCGRPPGAQPTGAATTADAVYERCQRLRPLQVPLPKPRPGDWLAQHEEPGQTWPQYRDEDPITADAGRAVLYVLPIGAFDAARERVLAETIQGLQPWFGLTVRTLPALGIDAIPADQRRRCPQGDWQQLRSTWILDEVLRPRLPADAACLIGFCADDLWPGPGWNFVFGEASPRHRVGVWSLHRNGDPNAGEAAFTRCLERTLKTATHEIGHMFGMRHCTAWACNLNGANHQDESDRQPLWLCCECLPKLVFATGVDPAARAVAVAGYLRERGLPAIEHHEQAAALLR